MQRQFQNRGNFRGEGESRDIKELVRNQMKDLHNQLRWNNSKMFSNARTGNQVPVYLDGHQQIFQNPRDLIFLKVQGVSVVKQVEFKSPALQFCQLIDLKLNVNGPFEDQVYSAFPLLIKNIRRGNTIVKYTDHQGNQQYSFGRKGLEKFFDMRYEYISPEQRFDDTCLDDEYHMHKNYILAGPLKAILEGHQVEVVKTLKANGENVQVSWNEDVEGWIICSKNVGLIAQKRSDISRYNSDRFVFAKEMAEVWFDILEDLEHHSKGMVSKLKADMTGKTLIGEYIGSQEHQHLVKYSRVTLIFYAVVTNNSVEDCWPCDQAFAFFDKYGLDKVHIQSLGNFTDYDDMCDELCHVFKEVAKSEIAKDEEGNVLYFIKRDRDGKNDKILSLAKLKTLEYRLFRKMREKLRNFYVPDRKSDAPVSEIVKRFVREAKELLAENDLPRPLQYYVELFKTAFEFLDSNRKVNIELLHTEYVTFSEKLLAYFCKVHKDSTFANQSSFFYSDVLDRQDEISFVKQSVNQSQPKMKRAQSTPSFRQSSNMEDSDSQPISNKVQNSQIVQRQAKFSEQKVVQIQKQNEPTTRRVFVKPSDDDLNKSREREYSMEDPEETKEVQIKPISQHQSQRTVTFIIPFATPGSGKSFCWEAIKKHLSNSSDWSFQSVSSDEVRGELMREFQQRERCDKDRAFTATQKSGPVEFNMRLQEIVRKCNGNHFKQNHLVFIDKNFPKDQIDRTIRDIQTYLPHNVKSKFLYLVPEIDPRTTIFKLPFSASFMLQAFSRCQKRKNHSTLDNSDPQKVIEIQTMFMLLSRDTNFDENFAQRAGLDGLLRLPMSNESIVIPQELLQALNKVLSSFKGVGKSSIEPIDSLIELLGKYDNLLSKHIDPKVIVEVALSQINPEAKMTSRAQNLTKGKSQEREIARGKSQEREINPKVTIKRQAETSVTTQNPIRENTKTEVLPQSDWSNLKIGQDKPVRKVTNQNAPPQKLVVQTTLSTKVVSANLNQKQSLEKTPTFLGISIEEDPQYERNLFALFKSGLGQAGEPASLIEEMRQIIKQQKPLGGWKIPNSHHVTSMFIGGNKQKLKSEQFEMFQEDEDVMIDIRAIIYVPDRLIAGICFPDFEIENEFPHLTLMVSEGWAPVLSNSVITATCGVGKPFHDAYEAARKNVMPAKNAGVLTQENVRIEKKGLHEVVFVLLRQPIQFQGTTKYYD